MLSKPNTTTKCMFKYKRRYAVRDLIYQSTRGHTDTESIILSLQEVECKIYSAELPDQIVDMVEKMIEEAEVKQDWDKQETEKPNSNPPSQINLNVWDWSGDANFFIIQQVTGNLRLHRYIVTTVSLGSSSPFQPFFTARAIYLVVYDLSRNLEERDEHRHVSSSLQGGHADHSRDSYLSQIEFWLQAIYNHASMSSKSKNTKEENVVMPKILLVGTHTNQIQAESTNIHDKTVSFFQKRLKVLRPFIE